MKTKFEGLIKEIVEEMTDDRINEIEDRPSREEDVMGDEIINDQAFDDFMQFI